MAVRAKNHALYQAALRVLREEKPMTLRQLYYRLISAGALANAQAEYKRLGGVMTRVREAGEVPRTWIVDHVRSTLKPSSWTGLADFADTVREAYRKDFWASLDYHVEIFVEKDAVAGTIQPVTEEYDIRLRVCRGYSSVSFAGEIADTWAKVKKPICAFYLGDFDPSGFDLERDLQEKLERYSGRPLYEDEVDVEQLKSIMKDHLTDTFRQVVVWERLGVREEDFEDFDLIRLPVKPKDRRSQGFTKTYGTDCAEVDALPPTELRRRVQEAIEQFIDWERWKKLQQTEQLEQETLQRVMNGWNNKSNLG
jgi:hypothetical protein